MRRLPAIALTAGTAALNCGLDRWTKAWAVRALGSGETQSFWGNLVVVRYTENPGAFLSLGAGWPPPVKTVVLLVLPFLLCAAVLAWCLVRERSPARIILLATVAGGGLGNLIDRMTNGFEVVDFLNFGIGPFRTGVLNVADLSVTLGLAGLLALEWARRRRPRG